MCVYEVKIIIFESKTIGFCLSKHRVCVCVRELR